MIPLLLILIPFLSGFVSFFIKGERIAKIWTLVTSVITFIVSILGLTILNKYTYLHLDLEWMPSLGSRFSIALDGMGQLLCLLTAIAFPVIFISTYHTTYRKANNFYALMLLTQAGLMGVFLSVDALLFYFFWELALVPAYFICSQWGGERRIAVTFKFFIYTFIGSLLMLVAILYLYARTSDQSFALTSFYSLQLTVDDELWVFWLFFAAFAVKMPIFPLHTWQPDTYEQAPTAATMVLSGVMVKMGIFGMIRWLAPVMPTATYAWGDTVCTLCIIGMIYASLLAIQQNDLKRLVAYSSIAHVGLMGLAIFATTDIGMQGVMVQMFSHGINIIGMWIVVELIERQFKTRKISELGGLANKAPALAILLVVVALANVALPLTNAFIGEFLMFSGVFTSTATKYNLVFAIAAGTTIILSAVYTLNMIQKILYGIPNNLTTHAKDIRPNERFILAVLVLLIITFGVYPKPVLKLTEGTVESVISRMIIKEP